MVQVTTGRADVDTMVDTRAAPIRRFSWGALFSGIIMVLVIQLLLMLLGLSVGLATIDPATPGEGTPDPGAFGLGAAWWWFVSWLVAVFVGGWVAGRLAGNTRRLDGAVHGAVTWAATTLVIFWLLTSWIGTIVGGAFSAIGNVATAAGQAVQTAVPENADVNVDNVMAQARTWMQQAGIAPENIPTEQELQAIVQSLAQEATGPGTINREDVVGEIATRTGLTEAEIESQINTWETQLQQAVPAAQQGLENVAETSAEAVASASFWSFVALVLGAVAGIIGGALGSPRDTVIRRVRRREVRA